MNFNNKHSLTNNNIIINDNKRWITLFEGQYLNFLDRNKGSEINSKADLIQLLNRKPRSFSKTLNILVTSFKLYDNVLSRYTSKLHPTKIAIATKNGVDNSTVQNQIVSPLTIKRINTIDSLNTSSLPSILILKKISELKTSLQNNNLPLPLNIANNLPTLQLLNNQSNISKLINKGNKSLISKTHFLQMISTSKLATNFQQSIDFNFNLTNSTNIFMLQKYVFNLLESAFRSMSCLISKPVFMATPDKVIINLFYFLVPGKTKKLSRMSPSSTNMSAETKGIATSYKGIALPTSTRAGHNSMKRIKGKLGKWNKQSRIIQKLFVPKNIFKLNKLASIISRIFNKPIEFDLVRLHLPFFDDNILVNAIAIMSKKIHVRNIIKYIFRKTILYSTQGRKANHLNNRQSVLQSFLSGIKIRIGGRLMTQRVIPRLSTRIIQRGAIQRGKVSLVDWSRVNLKNKRGAHSITVTMSHVL